MSSLHAPKQNHLLNALPASDYERLAPHLELVPMELGEVLYESGVQLRYVYFPTTAILSLLYVMEDGASAEIAIVGNEGILGISLFMGGETTPSRAVVQSAGQPSGSRPICSRLSSDCRSDHASPLRYTGADHPDGADGGMQSPSFGRSAIVPLVVAESRSPANERTVDDQELIANMLGVRREGVTGPPGNCGGTPG
jgi:hypothetical protein